MKAFKRIVCILLILLTSCLLTAYILLVATNKIISKEVKKDGKTTTSVITALDKDLFGIDVTKYKKYENVDTVTPDMVHEVVDAAISKKGYNPKVVDYILKEDDYQSMYTDYKKEIFGYLKGEIEKPNFPEDRLNGMIDRGLKKYNEENKNDKINVEKAILDFQGEVDVLLDKIDSKVEKIKQTPGMSTLLKLVTSSKVKYALLIGIIVCVALMLIIDKVLMGLIDIGITCVLSGIGVLLSKLITGTSKLTKILEAFGNSIKSFESDVTNKGIILIVGGTLIIIGTLILKGLIFNGKKKAPKEKDVSKELEENLEEPKEEKKNKKKSK